MNIEDFTDEDFITCAELAGFQWSGDKGLFVRHSNGSWVSVDRKLVDFARAILRKAQK